MDVISLQSGSNGNCFYVEADGTRLLFDAGISGRQAELRLQQHGRDIRDVAALFISHDHHDHSRSMGIFHRKYRLPVYVTPRTLVAARRSTDLGRIDDLRHFHSGQTVNFGAVQVHTVRTPHDSADGVAFIIESGSQRVGILTDLGHVFGGLRDVLHSLDAVVIESNYDREMLASGSYPEFLKRRIRGPGGHLSNDEAAALLRQTAGSRLRWACLCHLSEENNTPARALETHRQIVGRQLTYYVASRYAVSGRMTI